MRCRPWLGSRRITASTYSAFWSKPAATACLPVLADALDLAPNTLTFHFDRLRDAGLVTVRRKGRSMIYAARYETMNALVAYLTDNCCRGRPEQCLPVKKENEPRKTRKLHRAQTSEPVS